MQKLIKINTDHYIIVDDSEIKVGDYITDNYRVWQWQDDSSLLGRKKITHSTQPLYKNDFWAIQELKLSEVKELIGVVDVEKKANEAFPIGTWSSDAVALGFDMYKIGYNQAIEDNKEKKYTEEDINKIRQILVEGAITNMSCSSAVVELDKYIQSLKPKTSWEVEIVDGKFKLK